MSTGTRTTRAGSSSDAISVTITVSEVEAIVQKAVASAVNDIKELLNNKLSELNDRITAVESGLSQLEQNASATKDLEQHTALDLSAEIDAVRAESRQSLLLSNDNEQFSRRSNLRIHGLKPDDGEDCHKAASRFIRSQLSVSVNDSDIEVAHMTSGSTQITPGQRKRPVMLVRFSNKDKRDQVIRSRKALKGTHFAISEDLTTLNIKTMNRLNNDDHVRSTWSWNGKIFAILSNGKKVSVRPYQSASELLNN